MVDPLSLLALPLTVDASNVYDSQGRRMLRVNPDIAYFPDSAWADLFSAAPEMLAALEAQAELDAAENADGFVPKLVRAAIAKARGKVADAPEVVAVDESQETCWGCANNGSGNMCDYDDVDGYDVDLWSTRHVNFKTLMPARANVPACPGFKRAVKS